MKRRITVEMEVDFKHDTLFMQNDNIQVAILRGVAGQIEDIKELKIIKVLNEPQKIKLL